MSHGNDNKHGQNPSGYLRDLEEWQEHQYSPGYFVGGKIPPHLKDGAGNIFVGLIMLISAITFAIGTVSSILEGNLSLLNLILAIVFMIVAIRLLLTRRKKGK